MPASTSREASALKHLAVHTATKDTRVRTAPTAEAAPTVRHPSRGLTTSAGHFIARTSRRRDARQTGRCRLFRALLGSGPCSVLRPRYKAGSARGAGAYPLVAAGSAVEGLPNGRLLDNGARPSAFQGMVGLHPGKRPPASLTFDGFRTEINMFRSMKFTALSVRPWPGLRTDSIRGPMPAPRYGSKALGNGGRDQHLAHLVALADHFELRLATVPPNDLGPCEADKLGDSQAPEVAHFQHQAIAARVGVKAAAKRAGVNPAPPCTSSTRARKPRHRQRGPHWCRRP